MTVNIIDAIINLVSTPVYSVGEYYNTHNRANNMGSALEEYVKDIFAGTISKTNQERLIRFQDVFSYLGNQNNPPDFMIHGGAAVEVKKIETNNSSLALNSSYPKAILKSSSSMITQACLDAEVWTQKDLIYAVGVVNESNVTRLSMVYGLDYAASSEIYTRIKAIIKDGVHVIEGVEFAETNELGRINRVDPLGITYLRVRGMWGIQNPFEVFRYVYRPNATASFNFFSLIEETKYNSFENRERLEQLATQNENLMITNVLIKTPDNPVVLKNAKLITYKR